MLFEGKYDAVVVEEIVEVGKDDGVSLFITLRSGSKSAMKYGNAKDRDEDFDRLLGCMRVVHSHPIGIQGSWYVDSSDDSKK